MSKTLPNQSERPDLLGELINDHRKQNPGEPLLILKPGLSVSASLDTALRGLLAQAGRDVAGPVVVTVLSNTDAGLNPFSALTTPAEQVPDSLQLETLVALLGPGELIQWQGWPDHLLLLSAEAVERLAGPGITRQNVLGRLQDANGKVLLSDSLFLHDSSRDLFFEAPLEPHEQRLASPWGLLRYRLDDWISSR